MDMANGVQIMDEAVCISNSTNSLRKSMNPTVLCSVMGKTGWLGSLTLVWQPV